LYLAELGSSSAINSYPNAAYATWITMATIGYGDMVPVTGLGRLIVSFDALVGLVLIGSLVWLVTNTLKEFAGLPDEVEYNPRMRDGDEGSGDEYIEKEPG
jgi:voltage-gated potassium channel Kch